MGLVVVMMWGCWVCLNQACLIGFVRKDRGRARRVGGVWCWNSECVNYTGELSRGSMVNLNYALYICISDFSSIRTTASLVQWLGFHPSKVEVRVRFVTS